jgi:hypothetical protein
MSALLGSKRFRPSLRFVVFDVPVLLGAELRGLAWAPRGPVLRGDPRSPAHPWP